jgi:aspartyl-tRNA(Asn)/glutamyl-tRNA(Gln) amidotransferase subunit A
MSTSHVFDLSLSEVLRLLKNRQISPVELTRACLERIGTIDPLLNCFITLTPEIALAQAQKAEKELRKGEDPGLLAGVPMALKDLFNTSGILTTAGSIFFRQNIPSEDAAVVRKLKSAGSVLLGKLNMHEIALGITNVNPHYGACRNPWNPERITGGSSGGSAAALASGMCFGSLGTDTGGSIRIPSALCGTVGLKPTRGRVSLDGVIPLSWNMDHAGPMTRRVEDAALILQVIAGYDPDDPSSRATTTGDYRAGLRQGVRGWKIALAADDYFNQASNEVLDAVRAAGEIFSELGAVVESIEFPHAGQAFQANIKMLLSDAAAFHRERLEENPEGFGEDVLYRLRLGASQPVVDYSLARREQAILRRNFDRFFDTWDILLTPTTPITAPLIAGPDAVEQAPVLTRFTSPFNLTGLPALSIPCGFSRDGLPVGLQLVTRAWNEARLLQAGYAYEQATHWHEQLPQFTPGRKLKTSTG